MNNSATTRRISKIALEYNGNDKGKAKCVATNGLLTESPERQFIEMKMIAERNKRIKNWALTGYISPPKEIGEKLSDRQLRDICISALTAIGVTDNNQYRMDIHNSTRQKHIHFVVNRVAYNGKCTVQAHDIGKRFGNAVREEARKRGIKTDKEIGQEKRKNILKALIESIPKTNNLEELKEEMRTYGLEVKLYQNKKVGYSGMRIIIEKDKNPDTEYKYEGGYKLSDITNKLKMSEIKDFYKIKQEAVNSLQTAKNLQNLRTSLYRKGIEMKIAYEKDQNGNPTAKIENIYLKFKKDNPGEKEKNGWFYQKYKGFLLLDFGKQFNEDSLQKIFERNSQLQKEKESDLGFILENLNANELIEATGEIANELLKNGSYTPEPYDPFKKRKKKNKPRRR